MTRSLSSITTLAIVLFALVTYNFIGAQWTPAPDSPPNNNVEAPINVGGEPQVKAGSLGVNRLSGNRVEANVQMRSPQYCDENGNNCFGPNEVGASQSITPVNCPSGQAIIGISAGGTASCGNVTTSQQMLGPASCGSSAHGTTQNIGLYRGYFNTIRTCNNGTWEIISRGYRDGN